MYGRIEFEASPEDDHVDGPVFCLVSFWDKTRNGLFLGVGWNGKERIQ